MSTPLPPDRSGILTEQRNAKTSDLHTLSARACLERIHDEDRRVADAVNAALPSISAFVEAIEPGFLAGGRLVYIGAGTSGRLGVLDASEAPPTFCVPPDRIIGIIAGGDGALRRSSEGMEDDPAGAVAALSALDLGPRDAVLGIAAGGTTPYVHGGISWCKRLASPPVTGLLSCSPVGAPPGCDHLIVAATGPEVITGSTRMKAGTATKLVLNMISTTLMIRSGRVYENLMVDVRATNAKLRDRAARIVATLTGLGRPEAFALLDAAGGAAKTAVLMHRAGLDRAGAEDRLSACGGRLGEALGAG